MTTPQQGRPPQGYSPPPQPQQWQQPPGQVSPGTASYPPPGAQGQPPAAPGQPPQPTGPHVVQTDAGAKDGINKCPKCGASQIKLDIKSGNLRCGFCRFEPEAKNALATYGLDGPPSELTGVQIGSGSEDIIPSVDEVLTFKCSGCGAEVVIDTNSSTQARCHWCRNTLSMNQQIPNGAVPDMILPFTVPKDDAVEHIKKFVSGRMTFAHPKFKEEFQPENVLGVYLPYMVVDINAGIGMTGQGEHQTRAYTVGSENNRETRYDADLYDVARHFDLYVDDMTMVSASEYADQNAFTTSNNIINAIKPFDTENSVVYDSNYLAGYSSERRDSNIDAMRPTATVRAQDMARHHINETLTSYDRGVRWDNEQIEVRGERWVSAYLPVWLYSYYEVKKSGQAFTHYAAVNGRTGETMGSVPINQPKLLAVAGIIELVALILMIILMVVI